MMFSFVSYAQKTDFIRMENPVIDSNMQITGLFINGGNQPPSFIYSINDDYVVYQENKVRKVFRPDMASFGYPQKYSNLFFAKDKNGIYYKGNLIEVDTTGFKIVGDTHDYTTKTKDGYGRWVIIWKSGNKVFRDTVDVTGNIDVPTFESISRGVNTSYFKDKNYVYYFENKIEGSDSNTIVPGYLYPYDKNYVYEYGKIKIYEGDTVRPVNQVLMKTSKVVLLWEPNTHPAEVQPNIDPKTIKPLSRFFSMDKNNVYYQAEKTPVKKNRLKKVKVWDQVNSAYVSDGKNLYSYRSYSKVGDLDAKSFGMFPNSDAFFDKNGVYTRKGEKLPFIYTKEVSDKNTFMTEVIGLGRRFVYENQTHHHEINSYFNTNKYKELTKEQIALARENKLDVNDILLDEFKDPRKRFGNSHLYEYEGKIYFKDSLIAIADAQTFEKKYDNYYKDKNYVYEYYWHNGLTPLEGVDPETFEYTKYSDSPFYKDKNYIYTSRHRILKNQDVEMLGRFSGQISERASSTSGYYLFKNIDGYWIVRFAIFGDGKVSIRSLGHELDDKLKELLSQ